MTNTPPSPPMIQASPAKPRMSRRLINLGFISGGLFFCGWIQLQDFSPYAPKTGTSFVASGELWATLIVIGAIGLLAPVVAYVGTTSAKELRYIAATVMVTQAGLTILEHLPEAAGPLARSGLELRSLGGTAAIIGGLLFAVLLISAYAAERADRAPDERVRFRPRRAPSSPPSA